MEITGSIDFVEPLPTTLVRLDTIDPATVVFVSSNEAHFAAPWAGQAVGAGSVIEACAQVVEFIPTGKRYLGEPTCEFFGPF